jgi:TetR/AcrR family transcriptional regulator, transcriptional repressor for nem operon
VCGMAEALTKGEQTRLRIIELAAPVFNRRGYEGASMQEIMAATGLEKGGLYRHFSSKEELAAEAFRYAISRTEKSRTDNLSHIAGAIPRLRAFVERFVKTPSAIPGGCPLLNTAIDSDDGNSTLRKLARQGLAEWKERLADIVRDGKRNGEIRKSVKSRYVANTIIATLEGALMISRLEGDRQALEDAAESLLSFLSDLAVQER